MTEVYQTKIIECINDGFFKFWQKFHKDEFINKHDKLIKTMFNDSQTSIAAHNTIIGKTMSRHTRGHQVPTNYIRYLQRAKDEQWRVYYEDEHNMETRVDRVNGFEFECLLFSLGVSDYTLFDWKSGFVNSRTASSLDNKCITKNPIFIELFWNSPYELVFIGKNNPKNDYTNELNKQKFRVKSGTSRFDFADKAAVTIGYYQPDSSTTDYEKKARRLVAMIFNLLESNSDDTFLSLQQVYNLLQQKDKTVTIKFFKSVMYKLSAHRYLHLDANRISLKFVFDAEHEIFDWVNKFSHVRYKDHQQELLNVVLNDTSTGRTVCLTEKQKQALLKLSCVHLGILSGGAGCGKTTVIKYLVQLFELQNLNVLLVAPTGKAAKNLQNRLVNHHEVFTIHRKIWLIKSSENEEESIPDVVIVDEFSMVDVVTFNTFRRKYPTHTRYIMIGDPNQLASVQRGNLMNDLIASKKIVHKKLTENMRQTGAGKSIATLSKRILKNNPKRIKDDCITYLFAKNQTDYEQHVLQFYQKCSDNGDECIILIPSRKDGCVPNSTATNKFLQFTLNGTNMRCNGMPAVGDPVIFTTNDKDLGLCNGDVGRVINSYQDEANKVWTNTVSWQMGSAEVPKKHISWSDIELAYCMTVHKSQGSEYNNVLVALSKSHGWRLVNRNLLYTAVTRCKKQLHIVLDSIETWNNAVSIKPPKRNTNLWYLFLKSVEHPDVIVQANPSINLSA